MSKIRVVEIISLIKKNIVSFISICFFVVLAVGLFLGMGNAAKATEDSMYGYMEEYSFHDFEVMLPYGITDDEIKELKATGGVDSIDKASYAYGWFTIGEDDYQTIVSVLPEDVDQLSLRQGRLPEKKGEIVIEETWAKNNNLSIGDTISFEKDYTGDTDMLTKIATYSDDVDDLGEYFDDDNSLAMEYLTASEYVITGLVESPTRICTGSVKNDAVTNGIPIDVQTYVTKDSFRNDQFAICNRVLVSSGELRGYKYKDPAYNSKSAELEARLQTCLDSIYKDKNKQIADNKDSIKQRWQDEINDGEELLESSLQDLNTAIDELNESKSKLEKLEALKGAKAPYVVAGKTAIEESEEEINAAKEELEESKIELEDAKAQLKEFADAEIESMDPTILNREYSSNYFIPQYSTDMICNMRIILAVTFVVIGLLVCFSAISRFVTQQLKLIGTKKALGMRRGEIQNTFLLFTGISVTLGCIIGVFIFSPIIQAIILNTMTETFNVEGFSASFDVMEAILISLLEIVSLLIVTGLTVRKHLRKPVVSLLAGPEPPSQKHHAYEKLRIWNRLSLFTKTIINNSTTDIARIIATVVGIAGATSLLVISLTIYNNVGESVDRQFSKFFHFDSVIKMENLDEQTEKEVLAVLEKHHAKGTAVYWKNTPIEAETDNMSAFRLIVPKHQEEFKDLVELYDSNSNQLLDVGDGFLCGGSLYNWFGDKANSFLVTDKYGKEFNADVDAFFASHLVTGFMTADKSTYAEIYGEEAEANAFIVDTSKVTDLNSLKSDLKKVDGYRGVIDFVYESSYAFEVVQNLVRILVAIYLAISIVMFVLIVLNLLNQFIAEKKNELIVLRINGYGIKDAKRYIFTDTIFLSVISIILGAVIGCLLGNLAMSAFDTQQTYLIRQISYPSCLIGMAVSAILTFIMSAISLRQINSLKLSDVVK